MNKEDQFIIRQLEIAMNNLSLECGKLELRVKKLEKEKEESKEIINTNFDIFQ